MIQRPFHDPAIENCQRAHPTLGVRGGITHEMVRKFIDEASQLPEPAPIDPFLDDDVVVIEDDDDDDDVMIINEDSVKNADVMIIEDDVVALDDDHQQRVQEIIVEFTPP